VTPQHEALTPLQVLLRRPLLTGAAILTGVAAALVAPALELSHPEASVVVILESASAADSGRGAREQAALADLPVVHRAAAMSAAALEYRSRPVPRTLPDRLRVRLLPGTDAVELTFDAPTAEAALAGAEAAAAGYLDLRRQQVVQQATVQLRRLSALDRQLRAAGRSSDDEDRRAVLRARSVALLAREAPVADGRTITPVLSAGGGARARAAVAVRRLGAAPASVAAP